MARVGGGAHWWWRALVGTFLTVVTEQLKGGGLQFGSRVRGHSPPWWQGMAAGVRGTLSHTHGTEEVGAALSSLSPFFQSRIPDTGDINQSGRIFPAQLNPLGNPLKDNPRSERGFQGDSKSTQVDNGG